MKLIAETCIIGGSYILISASLIAFNKYLMTHERRSTLFSLCRRCTILFYSVCLNLRVHVGVNSKECRAFPSSKAMTAMHMLMTSVMSLLLYTAAPSLYPTMGKARENWRALSEP